MKFKDYLGLYVATKMLSEKQKEQMNRQEEEGYSSFVIWFCIGSVLFIWEVLKIGPETV